MAKSANQSVKYQIFPNSIIFLILGSSLGRLPVSALSLAAVEPLVPSAVSSPLSDCQRLVEKRQLDQILTHTNARKG